MIGVGGASIALPLQAILVRSSSMIPWWYVKQLSRNSLPGLRMWQGADFVLVVGDIINPLLGLDSLMFGLISIVVSIVPLLHVDGYVIVIKATHLYK